ncbi:pseudouridine synthase [Portibacter marinus]|uniref:pseudouridine synthase n=1 Tax=Portibacter marinus TaxID=2898660 RepID=UPI001F41FE8D|nr:pseudouridine synthase [Portibacter marinus]
MSKTYKIYKPYGYLSQFTKEHDSHKVLGDLFDFPSDAYPIGRLDKDSEGLLLLSNDKSLTDKILNPTRKLDKTYYVQVEGLLKSHFLEKLRNGVKIKIKTGQYHQTLPCKVEIIPEPELPPRTPPIRERKSIPTSWAKIILREGKNRQVRKMFAIVGFPVLRLVRYSIGDKTIEGMDVGDVIQIEI